MTSQVCHAAARPAVRSDPQRAQALLGCFLHMAELARVDGALAFPMDFPTFVQGVMGAWRPWRGVQEVVDRETNALTHIHTSTSGPPPATTKPGIWDAHPAHGAIIARAAKCLRVATAAASPIHLPASARNPTLFLAQEQHFQRWVV